MTKKSRNSKITTPTTSCLVPSEDDIKQLLAQVVETDLMRLPEAMFEISCAHILLRHIDKLRDELYDALEELERKVGW